MFVAIYRGPGMVVFNIVDSSQVWTKYVHYTVHIVHYA